MATPNINLNYGPQGFGGSAQLGGLNFGYQMPTTTATQQFQSAYNPTNSPLAQPAAQGGTGLNQGGDLLFRDRLEGGSRYDDGIGNDAELSDTAQKIVNQTQKMLAEQRAFQHTMALIKNDHAMRQAFITALRQQATDNKNSFN